MVGEIAHIIYAARLLTHIGDDVSNTSYWIGTLFPNIHRTLTESRFPTHPKSVSLSTLVGANDFMTGMRVHSWIDDTREKYFREHAVYKKLPWHPLLPFAFELYEDETLYPSYEDFAHIIRTLSTIDPSEEHIIHNRSQIKLWHTLLQDYFRSAPTDASRAKYMKKLQIPSPVIKEINIVVADLRNNSTSQEMLTDWIRSLEHIIL